MYEIRNRKTGEFEAGEFSDYSLAADYRDSLPGGVANWVIITSASYFHPK